MKDLLRLLRYVRPYLGRLVAAAICAVLISLTYLGLLGLIQPLLDAVLQQESVGPAATIGKFNLFDRARELVKDLGNTFEPLAGFADRVEEGMTGNALLASVLLVILFLFKGIFTYLSSYLTRWVGLQALRDLRTGLYGHIQGQSLSFFSENPTGQLISRVSGDVARMQRIVSGDLAESFRLSAVAIGQAIWLFYLNWKMAGFCLVLLPLIIYPVMKLGGSLRRISRRSMERMGDTVSVMKEGISGTRIVQAFGMQGFEVGRFRAALDRTLRAEKKSARLISLTTPVMELGGALASAFLLYYVSARIAAGKLSPGEAVTFMAALFMIYTSFKKMAKISNEAFQAAAASRRVFEIMDADIAVKERSDAGDLTRFRDRIEFNKVSFGYGSTVILHDIDLRVQRGKVVALVGSSGAGKSTLVNLLPRFYDATSGSITIDGTDIRDVTLRSLREQIGLVTQEIILFEGTVRDNIAYGRTDVSMERVREAAIAAHADSFICELAQGYDTPLGEGGHRLSQGQRQRLSIARAIMKNSPILILDEATSSLDTESEAEVQIALQNLMAGRTVVVIAHRLSTVRSADTIVVLEAGRVVEQGSHAELIVRQGVYARLHALQFRDEESAPQASFL